MLLPPRTISRLRRSLRPAHARFITTLPVPLPSYVRQWDPTQHTSQPTKSAASRNHARKVQRALLRHSQGFEVLPKDGGLENEREHIIQLNDTLKLAQKSPQRPGVHLKIWRVYSRAKERFRDLPSQLPENAWDILWRVQERVQERISLPTEIITSRLKELREDMRNCGRYETVGQRVHYLNGLMLHGHEDLALKEWQEDYEGANDLSRHDYKPEHLEFGARINAFNGNPDRACEIMDELFTLYPSWDPSIMTIVSRAHTDTTLARHHDWAKTTYRRFKERLGTDMTLSDYDAYFVGFLEARHLTHAKMVFRDMVKGGYLAKSTSPAAVEDVLVRLHLLFRLGTDISKMTSLGLQAITALSRRYHFHVYDQWLRSALVHDAPEAAAQIIDMMFSRRFYPTTKHLNLLLKVLLRSGDEPHVLKAENLGWRMIEEVRKSAVDILTNRPASELISEWVDKKTKILSETESIREISKANVITFALMTKHHAGRLQWEHVDYLWRRFKEHGLRTNRELMNILMDNKCRQGKFSETWKIYRSLTGGSDRAEVFPDGASIRCLWKTLRLALKDRSTRDDPELPRPRELLTETVKWWTRCRKRQDMERFRLGLAASDHGALSSLMVHCFSYTSDLAGSLVALHVLRKKFGIFPCDKTAEQLQRQAAWIDMDHKTPQERSYFNRRGIHTKNFEKLGRVYYILMERRWERMGITKKDYDEYNDEQIGDFGLNLLSEFIRVVMKRSHPPEAVEIIINQAKVEAGVPDMSTGDLDAFNVP